MLVDDVKVLNTKDLEWSKQNLPVTMSPESANAEEKESNELAYYAFSISELVHSKGFVSGSLKIFQLQSKH